MVENGSAECRPSGHEGEKKTMARLLRLFVEKKPFKVRPISERPQSRIRRRQFSPSGTDSGKFLSRRGADFRPGRRPNRKLIIVYLNFKFFGYKSRSFYDIGFGPSTISMQKPFFPGYFVRNLSLPFVDVRMRSTII